MALFTGTMARRMLQCMSQFPPSIVQSGVLCSLACAELFMLLARSRELLILVKGKEQRTNAEQQEVSRGLSRAVVLEGLVFVPASLTLVLIIVRPLTLVMPSLTWLQTGQLAYAVYGLLGIVSYEFPFATVRRIVTRIALDTLRSFASITLKEGKAALDSEALSK